MFCTTLIYINMWYICSVGRSVKYSVLPWKYADTRVLLGHFKLLTWFEYISRTFEEQLSSFSRLAPQSQFMAFVVVVVFISKSVVCRYSIDIRSWTDLVRNWLQAGIIQLRGGTDVAFCYITYRKFKSQKIRKDVNLQMIKLITLCIWYIKVSHWVKNSEKKNFIYV